MSNSSVKVQVLVEQMLHGHAVIFWVWIPG